MSKEQIFVVLATCLATNRGSFGIGDKYPCNSEDEAERMVLAGQATGPQIETVSKEDFEALQLSNDSLTNQLAEANQKLTEKAALSPETEKQITDLTAALSTTNQEKSELEKRVEALSKELAATNKKLAASDKKLKAALSKAE